MRFRRSAIILSITFILAISSCGMLSRDDSEGVSIYLPQDSPVQSDNFSSTIQEKWPEYIPDAIPELKGDISNIMVAPESHIRIFYQNVTDRQIENYLALLQEQGFEFTYIIYQQEGFPDTSEERLAKGDYDAVDITKGEYHMNLSSGGGTAVFDIYTDGFEDLVDQAMEIHWPEDIEDILPAPEKCQLTSLYGNLEAGYDIQCSCEEPNALQDYIDLLVAQGFIVMDESMTVEGNIIARKLQKDTLVVTFSGNCDPYFRIVIETIDPLKWPSIFENALPQPENCTLIDTRTAGPNTVYVDCVPENDAVLENFAVALEAIGFEEVNRLVNQENEPYMIVLTRNKDMATLSLETPNLVSITIYLTD